MNLKEELEQYEPFNEQEEKDRIFSKRIPISRCIIKRMKTGRLPGSIWKRFM